MEIAEHYPREVPPAAPAAGQIITVAVEFRGGQEVQQPQPEPEPDELRV